MRKLFPMLLNQPMLVAMALIVALLAAIVDQFVPRLLRNLSNSISISESVEFPTTILVTMAGAYVGAEILRILQRVMIEKAATRLEAKLVGDGLHVLLGNSLTWHWQHHVGQIHVRLERSARAIADLLKIGVGDVIGPAMGFGFAFIVLYEANHVSAFAALSIAVILCVTTFFQIKSQNGVRVSINRAREALGSDVVDAIGGVETVKLFGAQSFELTRTTRKAYSLANRDFLHHRAMGAFDIAKAVVERGGYVLVIGMSLAFPVTSLDLGGLLLVIVCYDRLIDPLRTLHRIVDEIAERLALAQDYLGLAETPRLEMRALTKTQNISVISFRNVWYRYPGNENWTLQATECDIVHGERVAIIGKTGVGKTTLGRLLCGLVAPEEGRVYVNGSEVSPIEGVEVIKSEVAMLTQEVRLFPGTVIENIRYGLNDAPIEEVRRVAELAGIGELLFDRNGRERQITSRGDGVSGGQKQRIGLARVLLRKASIVVLDEPTSAQDPMQRNKFFDTVFTALSDQTLIVITHDWTRLQWATKILKFDDGRLTNITNQIRSNIGRTFSSEVVEPDVCVKTN
jgi:ABC-type multidrug transport system fused ATPase/permease subunit